VRDDYEIEALEASGRSDRFGPVSAEMKAPARLILVAWPNPSATALTLALALPRPADVVVQ
jgi:hypothetical protein